MTCLRMPLYSIALSLQPAILIVCSLAGTGTHKAEVPWLHKASDRQWWLCHVSLATSRGGCLAV